MRSDTIGARSERRRCSALSVKGAAKNLMILVTGIVLGIIVLIAGLAVVRPAHADPDTDYANQLHGYGIYGPKDYNAWIGKNVCKRLYSGVDADAFTSAAFVSANLQRGTSTEQVWQFVDAAVNMYCRDERPVVQRAAERR